MVDQIEEREKITQENFSNIEGDEFKDVPRTMAQDSKGEQARVYRVFFSLTGWYWLATEYDALNEMFFGKVRGTHKKWGYFSLEELKENNIRKIPVWMPMSMEKTEVLIDAVADKIIAGEIKV